VSDRVAVFGATSAIAAEVARVYTGRGARLYLVGRNRDKLERVASGLGAAVVGSEAADLDETGRAEGLVDGAIAALGGGIDVAVIAQGLLGDQLATERAYAEDEPIIRTNLLSVMALLVPLANRMEAAGQGQIAVLSSVAADRGRPRNYTYGAAKGALNVYLQGMRTRLYARGVGVHTLKVGPVDTPMTIDHKKNLAFARPGPVAESIVAAIDRRVAEAYVPWYWRPIMAGVRAMPEAILQKLAFLSGR